MGELSASEATSGLCVTRIRCSRASISVDLASRLEVALGTSAEMWVGMLNEYDL
jgi:plasmid maintenance system antidote protein VapI